MKAFKTNNSYTGPIEKERKELGKNSEKLSRKIESDKGRISKKLKSFQTNFGSVPTKRQTKKKIEFNCCEYIIITLIGIIVMLLIFVVINSFLMPKKEDVEF